MQKRVSKSYRIFVFLTFFDYCFYFMIVYDFLRFVGFYSLKCVRRQTTKSHFQKYINTKRFTLTPFGIQWKYGKYILKHNKKKSYKQFFFFENLYFGMIHKSHSVSVHLKKRWYISIQIFARPSIVRVAQQRFCEPVNVIYSHKLLLFLLEST